MVDHVVFVKTFCVSVDLVTGCVYIISVLGLASELFETIFIERLVTKRVEFWT